MTYFTEFVHFLIINEPQTLKERDRSYKVAFNGNKKNGKEDENTRLND
jgi:hypothetical protein